MRHEPDHNARRAAILAARPDVRQLFGPTAATAWLGLAVVLFQFGVAALLSREPWWLAPIAALVFGAFAIHCLNCIVHECTHGLVFGNPAADRLLAIFVNMPSLIPSAMAFRHYHLLHHHHFGVRGMDSDVPSAWEVRLVDNRPFRKFLWLLLLPVSYGLLHPLKVRARLPLDRWVMVNILAAAVAWGMVVWLLGWHAVLYLLVSTWFATGSHPAGAHILQEHIAFDGGSGMASYYGPINRISVNLGYHLEHHDMPAISGWRLPALRRAAPEFYEGFYRHASRTMGLWRFVFDSRIGLGSRPIREIQRLRPLTEKTS